MDSVFKSKSKAKEDNFLDGKNLASTAMMTFYGWFVNHMHSIYPDKTKKEIVSEYQSPQIVMIGSESTGKSATIENLTKVPIFPTATGLCTRCPVRVVMIPSATEKYTITYKGITHDVNNNQLKAKVESAFAEIEKLPAGYTIEELKITIERPDAVRLDFIDLPGIVQYPPEAKEFTANLCQRYIMDPNSFLLCVVNVTIPRLTSYEPIARIIENKASDRCILVLTMADKLSEGEELGSKLVNRVLLMGDECGTLKTFKGCCAVINRDRTSANTLQGQAAVEKAWFETNIYKLLRDSGETKKNMDSLNLGVDQLLRLTNACFEHHIQTKWVPRTIEQVKASVQKLEREYAALGAEVTEAFIESFKKALSDSGNWLFFKFQATPNSGHAPAGLNNANSPYAGFFVGQPLEVIENLQKSMETAIERNINFLRDDTGSNTALIALPFKLDRFQLLLTRVKEMYCDVLKTRVMPALEVMKPLIVGERYQVINQSFNYHARAWQHEARYLQSRCVELVTLKNLTENKEVRTERQRLQERLDRHREVLKELQGVIN
jgi:GTP-binding protein EngB required for normal cell division